MRTRAIRCFAVCGQSNEADRLPQREIEREKSKCSNYYLRNRFDTICNVETYGVVRVRVHNFCPFKATLSAVDDDDDDDDDNDSFFSLFLFILTKSIIFRTLCVLCI